MNVKTIFLLFILSALAKMSFAQNLGSTQGDFMEIGKRAGYTNNDFMNKLWLYRSEPGDGWTSARLFDGISIDVSFLSPRIETRTWWERDPLTSIQRWGTSDLTYMTLNGPNGVLDLESRSSGWLLSTRATAFNPGAINGIKLSSGYLGDNKWAGISSTAEDVHSNNTALSLYAGQAERVRIGGQWLCWDRNNYPK